MKIKHGYSCRKKKHPLYQVWTDMRARCLSPKCHAFKWYGGRGIKIDPAWDDFAVFLLDMMPSWQMGLTLERKDNNGDYSSQNCIWASRKQQALNRRDNRRITVRGVTKTITDWARSLGGNNALVHHRLELGWSLEKALTTRAKPRRYFPK